MAIRSRFVVSEELTVGTSAVALSGSYPGGLQIMADAANAASIYIGGHLVAAAGTTRGIPIAPGDFWTPPDGVTDLSIVYAISTSAAQKLIVFGAL